MTKFYKLLSLIILLLINTSLFSQTSSLQKNEGFKIQKARSFGISNLVVFKQPSVSKVTSPVTDASLKNKYEKKHISSIEISYALSGGFLLGTKYDHLWRTGKSSYLGIGLGVYYLTSDLAPPNNYTPSEKITNIGIYIPFTFRGYLSQKVYLEPFAGPNYIIEKAESTALYSRTPSVSGSEIKFIGGCTLGYQTKGGFVISVRYNTVWWGWGIGYSGR